MSKKSVKIPNWQSESVSRRTDNTMAYGKGHTTIYKTLHIKLQIEQYEPHINGG